MLAPVLALNASTYMVEPSTARATTVCWSAESESSCDTGLVPVISLCQTNEPSAATRTRVEVSPVVENSPEPVTGDTVMSYPASMRTIAPASSRATTSTTLSSGPGFPALPARNAQSHTPSGPILATYPSYSVPAVLYSVVSPNIAGRGTASYELNPPTTYTDPSGDAAIL